MAGEFSAKINELESLRDRKKLLRQIHLSKQRLLYENPQAILPFIKEKIRHTLDYHTYSPDNDHLTVQTFTRNSTPIKYHAQNDRQTSDYLEIMKEQRQLIEKELQLVRLEEDRSRKGLEKRITHLIKSKENKTSKSLNNLRETLQQFTTLKNYSGKNKKSTTVLEDLQMLKQEYIRDGGRDMSLINEMDDLIKIASGYSSNHNASQIMKVNGSSQLKDLRQQERSYELQTVEQQIREIEKELELRQIREGGLQSKRVSPSAPDLHNLVPADQLNEQIYQLQKDVQDLKETKRQPFDNRAKFSPSPSLDLEPHIDVEDRIVILHIDYVTGISRHIRQAKITITVYQDQYILTQSLDSESVFIKPKKNDDLNASFIVNLRQPIVKCPKSENIFCLIELKTSSNSGVDYQIEAWAKFRLFPNNQELHIGKWKQPLYCLPVEPFMVDSEMYKLPQYHRGVIHYRIATPSDNVEQEIPNQVIDKEDYKPQNYYYRNINPFQLNNFQTNLKEDNELLNDDYEDDKESVATFNLKDRAEFGVQIIRIKNLNMGDSHLLVKVRLTVYHTGTDRRQGQIMMSSDGPVTCCTSSVRADFKAACFQYGRQMARFHGLEDLSVDCIVVARIYVEEDDIEDGRSSQDTWERQQQNLKEKDEFLVGWSAIPLVKHIKAAKKNPNYITDSLKLLKINKGAHDLQVYEPPVLPPSMIFFDRQINVVGQNNYGRVKLKLRLFHTQPSYDSATSSENESPLDESDHESNSSSQNGINKLWVPIDRKEPEILPHHYEDGIDVYIDYAKFLPDSVTAVKIEGSIVDRALQNHGPKFSAITTVNSDIYNPRFDEKIEIREPTISPSATLLLKFLTFDRQTKELVVMGYAGINLFTETGTGNQPEFDNLGVLVSLNDGGHQVRIYQSGPNDNQNNASKSYPFSSSWFQRNRIQPLPGSTVLLRMYKPPKNNDGRTMNKNDVPRGHWHRLGVFILPPRYEDGYYYSMSCRPSPNELRILRSYARRTPIILEELISSRWADNWRKVAPLAELHKVFDGFTLMPFNVNHLVHYDPTDGFKISVDGAVNIPWTGITLAHLSLYPPGALYMNKPYMAYDRPFFVSTIDMKSTVTAPIWTNGWKTYRRRKYNEKLIAILHLHEMTITTVKDDFKFSLENEAWIPIPIFDGPYCVTKSMQMPLILGSPSFTDFEKLKTKSVREFLTENRKSDKLDILPQTSVIVRQCDSRRVNEVSISADDELLTLDQSYLPEKNLKEYTKLYHSNKDVNILSLIPAGFTQNIFENLIRVKFRSLIYKYYDQDGFKRL